MLVGTRDQQAIHKEVAGLLGLVRFLWKCSGSYFEVKGASIAPAHYRQFLKRGLNHGDGKERPLYYLRCASAGSQAMPAGCEIMNVPEEGIHGAFPHPHLRST